jgi:GTP pyrophosphokinase
MVSTTSSSSSADLETLLATMGDLSPSDRELVSRAYHYAEKAHEGQVRRSGEPYFTHCLAVAMILADMRMDAETVSAGLLHDVVEDTAVTSEDLERDFGYQIARLVSGVTKLAKLPKQDGEPERGVYKKDAEFFRRMMLTMDADVRVVIVKLADRLHNMRTLGYMNPEKQRRIAQETMDIYAPLANRLGIWQIKWELEDLSFRHLEPEAYKAIASALQERRADREAYVAKIVETLRCEIEAHGIKNAHISARPKHITSIYKKMSRKGVSLDGIYDIRAVRVIVPELTHCYLVLGLVHQLWRPIPGEFDDYIASPKDNFYRSLHTAVVDDKGRTLEVQIRTWDMHEDAEYGIAAHWRYKEGRQAKDDIFEKRIAFLRRLMEFGATEEEDASEFLSRMRREFFEGRIFTFTPKGDIIDLPEGATPIDFAYAIHTDIGHRCRGAKVRGKLVSLSYQLQTGDQVEILTAKRGGPSLDWLNSDLGYVKTSRAKEKIRYYFRKQHRENNIASGRAVLDRELKRLGLLDKVSLDSVAALFGYTKLDDYLVAIGIGEINGAQIAHEVLEDERRKREQVGQDEMDTFKLDKPASREVSVGVNIMGTGGMLVNLARCCNPLPGDDIVGYVTRGRGVTVHTTRCPNIVSMSDAERLIDVSWGTKTSEQCYNVPVEIVAHDRPGLLKDVSTVVSDAGINISSVSVVTKQDIATLYLNLQVATPLQLTRVLSKVETIPNVFETRRRLHS